VERAVEQIKKDVKHLLRDIEGAKAKVIVHREAADALEQAIVKDEQLVAQYEAILERIENDVIHLSLDEREEF
jgi:cell division septum initiation protein DivIVA